MRFRVLGPVEVVDRHPIASHQLRRLLTALLVRRDLVVTRDFVLDLLWPDGLPPTAVNSLHSKLSRLRRVVDGLQSVPGGYIEAAQGMWVVGHVHGERPKDYTHSFESTGPISTARIAEADGGVAADVDRVVA